VQRETLVALIVALGSGVAIGLQSTLNGVASRQLGPTVTGLLVNVAGGAAAGALFLLLLTGGTVSAQGTMEGKTPWTLLAVGVLGIAIMVGSAFSLPRVGVAAGLSALIMGQMAVAVVMDAFGWGGGEPIPISAGRIGGLLMLLVATWLLLPRE
jgi:transporter family-2 protein